jgi:hypothetical protein
MTRYTTTALVLASPGAQDVPGGRGEDFGKAAPLAFLVLLLFFIAVGFLIRSMNKHLKRVPESFDDPSPSEADRRDGEFPAPGSKPDRPTG